MVRDDPFVDSPGKVLPTSTHLVVSVARRIGGQRFFLASPMDRFAAFLVDMIILVPLLSLLTAPLRQQLGIHQILDNEAKEFLWLFLTFALSLGVIGLYQTVFIAYRGATPGKLFLGLRVVSIWDGQSPTLRMAAQRAFFWCLEAWLILLPNLAIFANARRRVAHDRLSDCIVTAPPLRAASAPAMREVAVVHGAVAAMGLSAALYLAMEGYQNYHGTKDLRLANQKVAAEFGLCAEVNRAVERDLLGEQRNSRLDVAMSLFAVGFLDSECLEREADFAIRRGLAEDKVFLAKALALGEGSDLAEDYRTSICEQSPEGTACAVGKLQQLIANQRWPEVSEFLHRKLVDAPGFLEVWAYRHHLRMKDYERAAESLRRLTAQPYLAEFIGSERVKLFWYQGRHEESEVAALASLENFSMAGRLEVANWYCEKSLRAGCLARENLFCQTAHGAVKDRLLSLNSAEVGVTYLSLLACQNPPESEWQDLSWILAGTSAQSFLQAMREQSRGYATSAVPLLRDILENEKDPSSPYFIASLVKWLALTQSTESMDLVFERWSRMDKVAHIWFEMGEILLGELIARKNWRDAYVVAKRLLPSAPDHEGLQKNLIVAAYFSGKQMEAYEYWKKSLPRTRGPDFNRRQPAQEGDPYSSLHLQFLRDGERP